MARVIGLSGPFGAGCSTMARMLQEHGYRLIKASKYIMEWAGENDIGFAIPSESSAERRRALQVAGDILRMREGSDAIARYALRRVEEEKRASDDPEGLSFAIDCLKNRAEIEFLRDKLGPSFTAVSVNSSVQSRVRRRSVIDSYGGNLRLIEKDDRKDRDEFGSDAEWGQQVLRCDVAADISIDNDENVETG